MHIMVLVTARCGVGPLRRLLFVRVSRPDEHIGYSRVSQPTRPTLRTGTAEVFAIRRTFWPFVSGFDQAPLGTKHRPPHPLSAIAALLHWISEKMERPRCHDEVSCRTGRCNPLLEQQPRGVAHSPVQPHETAQVSERPPTSWRTISRREGEPKTSQVSLT